MQCLIEPELTPDETALVHHIYRKAAENLSEKGRLLPVAFFKAGVYVRLPGVAPGNVAVLPLDMPGDPDGKDALAEMMRKFAARADATLAILVFESWMVRPSAAEARYFKDHGEFLLPPSQHPDRIEIVLFNVNKPGGHSWSAWVEIRRDKDGRPSIPTEPPVLEYLHTEGRFANVLDGETGESPPTRTTNQEGDMLMNKKKPATERTCWDIVAAVLSHSPRTLLHGPPGTGKTHAACRFSLENGQRVYSLTLTEETPAAELRGHYILQSGAYHWQDGPAVAAWRSGGRLVLNEIQRAGRTSMPCSSPSPTILPSPNSICRAARR